MEFKGKNLLIAGGSSEIGLESAKLAIENGLFPTLTFRSEKGLEKIAQGLKDFEGEYKALKFDLGDSQTVNSIKELADPDYLLDLVHGSMECMVSNLDYEKTLEYYRENVVVRALLLKEISRIMLKKRFGRMVYISSIAAHRPNHGQGFYASSKLASETLYKSLGHELGRKGISSVVLRPGYIDAGRAEKFIEKNRVNIIKQIPSRNILTAEEFAKNILFFMSDSSLSFNATDVTIDGGFSFGKSI